MVLFVNPLTPKVKPWIIQSFLTFDSMDRILSVTIHCKAVEQYFTVVQFHSVVSHGHGAVRSERASCARLLFYFLVASLVMDCEQEVDKINYQP